MNILTPNIYSIMDFGAKGDGLHDDTPALRAALAAARAAQGVQVLLAPGTTLISPVPEPITIYSGLSLRGPSPYSVLKVADRVGDYTAVFSSHALVEDFSLENFTFDQNPAGNPDGNVCSAQAQMLLQLFNFRRIRLRGIRARCCGMNAVWLSGGHRPELGHFSADVAIHSCDFQFVRGHSVDPAYDNSMLYLEAWRARVTNNTMSSEPEDAAAGGIEIHSPQAVVSGNVLDGFGTAVYAVTPYDNSHDRPDSNIAITGNSISRAENGVYCIAGSPLGLRGLSIVGNTISLSQKSRNATIACGVALIGTGSHERFTIANNTISYEPDDWRTAGRLGFLGNHVGILVGDQGDVRDGTVTGNVVSRAPAVGIWVGNALHNDPLHAGTSCRGLEVALNVLADCGQNPNIAGANRAALHGEGDLRGVAFRNNTIRDSGIRTAVGLHDVLIDGLLPTARVVCRGNSTITDGCSLRTAVNTPGQGTGQQ